MENVGVVGKMAAERKGKKGGNEKENEEERKKEGERQ